jgi:hypothetical protein
MEESWKIFDLFNDLLSDMHEKKGNDKEEPGSNGRKDGSKNPDDY